MIRKLIIFAFLYTFSVNQLLYSQDLQGDLSAYYLENQVIFKLKPEFRHIVEGGACHDAKLQMVFDILEVDSIWQKFPKSGIPEGINMQSDLPYTDLTLIFEIHYHGKTPVNQAVNLIHSLGFTAYANPHPIAFMMYTPDDTQLSSQYYLTNIRAFEGWGIYKGDSSVVIGITDTGYEFAHPDLVNAVAYNMNDTIDGIDNDNDGFVDNYKGWDLGSGDNNPQYDATGHGIHVSGIAGASVDNTFGIAGVGFNSLLLPVKVDNQYGNLIMTYESIVYAADHGCRVINCSWGSPYSPGSYGQDIVNYASFNRNALVVAAAGNSNNEVFFYPASYTYTLNVAGTNAADNKWPGSSYYYGVDISAPGELLYSAWAGSGFTTSSGTSMASPCVAGCAAIVSAYFPHLNMLQIAERLRTTADIIDTIPANASYHFKLGKGRVNLFRALTDSFSPAVRMIDHSIEDNNNQIFVAGDTISVIGSFINYLSPCDSLVLRMECLSTGVTMIDSVVSVGALDSLIVYSNTSSPFKFVLGSQITPSTQLKFLIHIIDHQSFSWDYITFSVNNDFIDIDTNNIRATITSKSNIGYNDMNVFIQGSGFRYKNSASLFFTSGLMVGNSTQRVSDNLVGFSVPYDNDFTTIGVIERILPPYFSDFDLYCEFCDTTTSNPLNIKVLQSTHAWDSNEDADYIIVQYRIINIDTVSINGLHVGFYADWDLKYNDQNRSKFDAPHKMGYTFAIDSSLYTGIQLLTPGIANYYAFDNDGMNSSISLTDGFTGNEKYVSLTNNRLMAGDDTFGNDVSGLLSSGPFNLLPSDTITVAFALLAAEHYTDLLASADRALIRFYDPFLGVSEPDSVDVDVFPNPFSDFISIMTPIGMQSDNIKIFDINGRHMIFNALRMSDTSFLIDTRAFSPGIYVVLIEYEGYKRSTLMIRQ